MKILAWRNSTKDKFATIKTHRWIHYSNPRNNKVTLQACAHCGVLKSPLSAKAGCVSVNRVTNMLNEKGWVELQIAS